MTQQDAEQKLALLQEQLVDDWLIATFHINSSLDEIHKTLSWRVTRPLRLFKTFTIKVDEVGLGEALALSRVALQRRLAARR